jgi:hypothetical protein
MTTKEEKAAKAAEARARKAAEKKATVEAKAPTEKFFIKASRERAEARRAAELKGE